MTIVLSDQRKLFKAVSTLVSGGNEEQCPPHVDPVCLRKINNIRTRLDTLDTLPRESGTLTAGLKLPKQVLWK